MEWGYDMGKSNAGKMPAFQFYPADWRKDLAVQSLDYADRGIWFEMLCLMHESETRGVLLLNQRPLSDDAIARLLGVPEQEMARVLDKLLAYGVASRREDGALYNRRMVRDERLRQLRAEGGQAGAAYGIKGAGYGIKGGRPRKTTGDNKPPLNPPPSSSSSSSKDIYVEQAKTCLDYLNQKTGRNYKPVQANLNLIMSRMREGATLDECKAVIDAKCGAWMTDPKMRDYLRPATLFNASKFASYAGEQSSSPSGGRTIGGETWE